MRKMFPSILICVLLMFSYQGFAYVVSKVRPEDSVFVHNFILIPTVFTLAVTAISLHHIDKEN